MSLSQRIQDYIEKDPVRFHMPGHKGIALCDTTLKYAALTDITELSFSDNLHMPDGAIADIEKRYATIYNAKRSFLLVNGSTAGVLAMMLSLGLNKRILLARDAHRSALSGCILAGHIVTPMPLGANVSDIETLISKHEIDAVLVTHPDYHGSCLDLKAISDVTKKHNVKLLVDSAHGAHFPFIQQNNLPLLPSIYADMWVCSIHKTLPALTQTAILNMSQRCEIDEKIVARTLDMVQTSSPSYILMQSAELALSIAESTDWHSGIQRNISICNELSKLPGVSAAIGDDPYRITIECEGINGFFVATMLERNNIFVEMADIRGVVLISSPFDPVEWYNRLCIALRSIVNTHTEAPHSYATNFAYASKPLDVRKFAYAPSEPVALLHASGCIATEAIGAYPPGTAHILPGEVITSQMIEYLIMLRDCGCTLFGVNDGCVLCAK